MFIIIGGGIMGMLQVVHFVQVVGSGNIMTLVVQHGMVVMVVG